MQRTIAGLCAEGADAHVIAIGQYRGAPALERRDPAVVREEDLGAGVEGDLDPPGGDPLGQ
eukprot:9918237-Lingulodinium_polyedra.AAC.1